jgi:hypothetical protein
MPDPRPDKPDLSTHPLVTAPHGESDTPPGLVALTGYFGPSRKTDSIRLYPSLDFQAYFELPKDAIIATNPADVHDERSPTIAHVKAGTAVEAVQRSKQPVEAYLQGGITGAHMLEAVSGGHASGPQPQATLCTLCPCHSKIPHPIPITHVGCVQITHSPHYCIAASICPHCPSHL